MKKHIGIIGILLLMVSCQSSLPNKPAPNEIWYTATDKLQVETDSFGVDIIKHVWRPSQGIGILVSKDEIIKIGEGAFGGCTSLTSVIIPDSVTSIGEAAFYGCTSLTRVIIPDSVTLIGDGAFHDCTSLTRVIIPDSVASVGDGAFGGCTSLKSVIIGKGVTEMVGITFYECTSLKEVYCKSVTPPTAVSTDAGWALLCSNSSSLEYKIYVPRNSVEAYKSAEYWSDYADYIVGYDF